eukprot:22065-Amorphochlora_amoeboformis.AAC.3
MAPKHEKSSKHPKPVIAPKSRYLAQTAIFRSSAAGLYQPDYGTPEGLKSHPRGLHTFENIFSASACLAVFSQVCLTMGRKKIDIKMITSEKNRQVTFNKRRVGLMKKDYLILVSLPSAMELSILCGCEVGLVVLFDRKMHVYASSPIDEIIRR